MTGPSEPADKVLSLSRARKARTRADKARQADANAAKHGRSKADRAAEAGRTARATALLDAHKRDQT